MLTRTIYPSLLSPSLWKIQRKATATRKTTTSTQSLTFDTVIFFCSCIFFFLFLRFPAAFLHTLPHLHIWFHLLLLLLLLLIFSWPLSSLRLRTQIDMREIVHLQVGQCGNQIGSKVRIINIQLVWHTWTNAPLYLIFHNIPNLTCLIIKQRTLSLRFTISPSPSLAERDSLLGLLSRAACCVVVKLQPVD